MHRNQEEVTIVLLLVVDGQGGPHPMLVVVGEIVPTWPRSIAIEWIALLHRRWVDILPTF